MNVHFSYKSAKSSLLEQNINIHIEKLRKRLQVFRPELVSLYGMVDEGRKTGVVVSLNLRLPSGQMAAQGIAESDASAVKIAFDDITRQLTSHKDLLRGERKWPRRGREGRTGSESQVPFEETFVAVRPELVSEEDVNSYVNANLPRMNQFVRRELRYRENSGQIRPNQVSVEEVVDEAIANALDDSSERPEKMRLEPWLYRLATTAIQRLSDDSRGEATDVPLEAMPNYSETDSGGSDEPVLQFHQPDEAMRNGDLIADTSTANPEDVAVGDEMMAMVEMALREAKPEEREAFILFTMEGFTVREIAIISERNEEEVRASIALAREHLRHALPGQDQLEMKLIQHSKSA